MIGKEKEIIKKKYIKIYVQVMNINKQRFSWYLLEVYIAVYTGDFHVHNLDIVYTSYAVYAVHTKLNILFILYNV